MAMALVMTMVMPVRANLFHTYHAAVRHLAFHMLELDCGVVNMELPAQPAVDFLENAGALRGGNIRNGHMTG